MKTTKKNTKFITLFVICGLCVFGMLANSNRQVAKAEVCGHDSYVWEYITAPTWTTTGFAKQVCSVCSDVQNDMFFVGALNDTSVWDSEIIAPTLTTNGTTNYTYKTQTELTYSEVLPKLTETGINGYEKRVVSPTLNQKGMVEYTSKVTFKTFRVELESFSEKDKWNITVTTPPTCENVGSGTYVYKQSDTLFFVGEIAALGHNIEWVITSYPTSSSVGSANKACTNDDCEYSESAIELPKLPNNLISDSNYVYTTVTKATLSNAGLGRYSYSHGDLQFNVDITLEKLFISGLYINSDGDLILNYTNGSFENLGKVVGEKGDKGDNGSIGSTGSQGIAGSNGLNGSQGISGSNGINGVNGLNGVDGKDATSFKSVAITAIVLSLFSLTAAVAIGYLFLIEKRKNATKQIVFPVNQEVAANNDVNDKLVNIIEKEIEIAENELTTHELPKFKDKRLVRRIADKKHNKRL